MAIDKDMHRSVPAGLRRRAEKQLEIEAPEEILPRTTDETQRLLHELQVHQIELELQNAELRQARNELETALEQYTDLYDFAPVGYVTLDQIGDISAANLTAASLFGVVRSKLLGQRFALFVSDETRQLFTDFLGRVFASGCKESCEVTLVREGLYPYMVQVEAVSAASGRECRAVVTDISERKRTEQTLMASERKYRLLFDNMAEGFALYELLYDDQGTPVDWRVLEVNDAYFMHTGIARDRIVGRRMSELFPEAIPEYLPRFVEVVADQKSMEFETYSKSVDRYQHVMSFPVGPHQFANAIIDITGRRRTEDALRGSEERLKFHLNNSPMAVIEWDRNLKVTRWTGESERMFGWSSVEAVGKPMADLNLIYAEDSPIIEKTLSQLIDGVSRQNIATNRIYTKSGEIRYCTWYNSLQTDLQGRMVSVLSKVIDYTELKLAEDERQKFVSLAEHSFEFIGMCDLNLVTTYVNDAGIRLVGLENREEAFKASILDCFFPEDRDFIEREFFPRVLREGRGEVEIRFRNFRTGEPIWMLFNVFYIRDAAGTPVGLATVSRDITETKRAVDHLDLLAETASQLLLSDSPEEIIESICTRAMSVLGCHVFFNFLVDEDLGRLHLNACAGIPEEEQRKIEWLDAGVPGSVCVVRDACRSVIENSPTVQTGLMNTCRVKAYSCHPLISQDRLLGTLSFGSRKSHFSDDEVYLMQAVGDQVAIAIERTHIAQALYKSNEELDQRVAERTKELAASVNHLQAEIWERELVEKRLQRINRLYAVLSETNQAIVHASDRETLFHDFCRIAVEQGEFLLSWVGLIDGNSGQIRVAESCGATGYLKDIRINITDEQAGSGPTGISVRNGTYYICNDFQNDSCTQPWHEQGRAYGIKSSAAIALFEEGEVVGALTIYAEEVDYFDQQQVEMLVQMGADVSFALDNLLRVARHREVEQKLRKETLQRLQAVEDLRKQEHILIQQNRQAAMGEMIGNIAHQWRQPLNTLGLLTQRFGFFYGSPNFNKEFVDTSVAKSMEIIQYMSRTIDDFRNFFSPEREMVEFSVNEAVSKALSLVEANFKEHGINIERLEREEFIASGYPNEYAQVMLNILINARDAISARTIQNPRLKITIWAENGASVVTIGDNAGGIPEEYIDKIFDPYFTTKGPQQGTGVGLFMSKAIIENNMGGRLTVRNTAEGAEFRVEV
ncbi:MAG: PAS domain S-box protein [Pelobacteraceae bacterium]